MDLVGKQQNLSSIEEGFTRIIRIESSRLMYKVLLSEMM